MAAPNGNLTRIVDGQLDWSAGIDSGRVQTMASDGNPNGLQKNQLAWLTNGTVRNGGVSPRAGWIGRVKDYPWAGIFQGGFMYQPKTGNPYAVLSIGGRIYRVRTDTDFSVEDLSATFNIVNPADQPQAFFIQGEEFLIIQAGDLVTLPLFWDGTTLRRSVGFIGAIPAGTTPIITNFSVTIMNLDFIEVGYTYPAGTVFNVNQNADKKPPVLPPVNVAFTLQNAFIVPAIGVSATVFVTAMYTPNYPDVPLRAFNADHPVFDSQGTLNLHRSEFLAAYPGGVPSTQHPVATYRMAVTAKQTQSTGGAPTAAVSEQSELLPSGPMDYYMGRIWYAFGRQYAAGDIVGSHDSGTGIYNFRDSILKNTENPVSLAGDAFIVPTQAGNITALKHSSNIETALGQGRLYVYTLTSAYYTDVPPTRTEWLNLKEPLQRIAHTDFGAVGERCTVGVNGDLFFQSLEGVRSETVARSSFAQWGDVPISAPENRVLDLNDKTLLPFASGIKFDNRLWQTVLPFNTPKGVAHRGIMTLDFDILGSYNNKLPPAWEGMMEGLDVLQLFTASFSGAPRAFGAVVSKLTGNIDFWEFTTGDRFDSQVNGDGDRITWFLETPAFTWNDPFLFKKLDGLELWFDQLSGTVQFMVEYKVDQNPCWLLWHTWKECSAKDCREDTAQVFCPAYPVQSYCDGYRSTMSLPTPPSQCDSSNDRPTAEGYQFQVRITIKGSCRLRGLRIYALPRAKAPYSNLVCAPEPFFP